MMARRAVCSSILRVSQPQVIRWRKTASGSRARIPLLPGTAASFRLTQKSLKTGLRKANPPLARGMQIVRTMFPVLLRGFRCHVRIAVVGVGHVERDAREVRQAEVHDLRLRRRRD